MITILSIALLLVGSIATLSAFGGSTWRNGTEPLVRRITLRGWISLSCLFAALVFGATKEMLTRAGERARARSLSEEKTLADGRIQELSEQLADSRSKLALANANLENVNKQLDSANVNLIDLRKLLAVTGDALSEQSKASLLTALSNTKRTVSDVFFFLPLTEHARRSSVPREAFLPPFKNPACRDLVDIKLSFHLGEGKPGYYYIHLRPGDLSSRNTLPDIAIPAAYSLTALSESQAREDPSFKRAVGQTSLNGFLFSVQFHAANDDLSAARLYGAITGIVGRPFSISAEWLASLESKEDIEAYRLKYPDVLEDRSWNGSDEGGETRWHPSGNYPEVCSEQIRKYFSSAFDKLAIMMALNGDEKEALVFKLKATRPRPGILSSPRSGSWDVLFEFDSAPMSMTGVNVSSMSSVEWSKITRPRR